VGVPRVMLDKRPCRRRIDVMAREEVVYGMEVVARAALDVFMMWEHRRCGSVGKRVVGDMLEEPLSASRV